MISIRRGALQSGPRVASKLGIITQPGGATSGSPFLTQPVVDVQNAQGFRDYTSGASITATIATGAGAIVGTAVVVANRGRATFSNLGITGGDNYTLRFASAPLTSVVSDAISTTVVGTRLAITQQPTGAVYGQAFTTQPVVQIQDVLGNLATTSTALVTATIATGSGALIGTVAVNAVAGVATFTDIGLTGADQSFTLAFSSSGLTAATSGTVTLVAPSYSAATNTLLFDSGLMSSYTDNNLATVTPDFAVVNGRATPWTNGEVVTTFVDGTGGTIRRGKAGGSSAATLYICTTGGTTTAIGAGPTGTGANIDDNGVKWTGVTDDGTHQDVLDCSVGANHVGSPGPNSVGKYLQLEYTGTGAGQEVRAWIFV